MSGPEVEGHADPDIQEQWDRAARALDKWLRPYVQDQIRWDLARGFVYSMAEQGFRPPLRPPKRATVDPEAARVAAARGAELARQSLAHRDTG